MILEKVEALSHVYFACRPQASLACLCCRLWDADWTSVVKKYAVLEFVKLDSESLKSREAECIARQE